MVDYLITGCGRTGTGYFSKLLNNNGCVCGHESYYSTTFHKQKFPSESSWLATPHIRDNINSKIIRVFRNPLDNIKSINDLLLFSPRMKHSKYQQYVLKYIPEINIDEKSMIINSALYFIKWNELFDNLIGDIYYEAVSFDSLIKEQSVVLHKKEFRVINGVVNAKKGGKGENISKDDIIKILNEHNLYDDVLNKYNEMLNDEHRKI